MWAVLKAELAYTKFAWMFAYGLCGLLFGAAAVIADWDVVSYMTNTSVVYGIMLAIVGSQADGEKRTRSLALLPLSPRALATLDALYIAICHLGMVALWIALLALKPASATPGAPWTLISHNGLLLSLVMALIVNDHLNHYKAGRYKRLTRLLLLAAAAALAALIYTGDIAVVGRFFSRHYGSPSGALAATLTWLGLSQLSVALYARRDSYLV